MCTDIKRHRTTLHLEAIICRRYNWAISRCTLVRTGERSPTAICDTQVKPTVHLWDTLHHIWNNIYIYIYTHIVILLFLCYIYMYILDIYIIIHCDILYIYIFYVIWIYEYIYIYTYTRYTCYICYIYNICYIHIICIYIYICIYIALHHIIAPCRCCVHWGYAPWGVDPLDAWDSPSTSRSAPRWALGVGRWAGPVAGECTVILVHRKDEYPLVMTNSVLLKIAIYSDISIKHGDFPYC